MQKINMRSETKQERDAIHYWIAKRSIRGEQ